MCIRDRSADDVQDGNHGSCAVSAELAALIAAIPESEFTSLNSDRNRKIIELHTQGMGTNAISRQLAGCGITNSAEPSISYFLKKHRIPANKPGRADKK